MDDCVSRKRIVFIWNKFWEENKGKVCGVYFLVAIRKQLVQFFFFQFVFIDTDRKTFDDGNEDVLVHLIELFFSKTWQNLSCGSCFISVSIILEIL